jgi:hypothetical protein
MSTTNTVEKPVVRCYNDLAVRPNLQSRYTAEGLFVADSGSGRSPQSEDVPGEDHRPATGGAFDRIEEISRRGGIGLIRTSAAGDELVVAGEWAPNCATFREVNRQNGTVVRLTGVQMARFGLLVPGDDHFSTFEKLYQRTGSGTAVPVTRHEDTIRAAIDGMERTGRLRKPTYL